jgi:3-hydroxyisobutyrate dehydrogenase
MRVGFIGLGAMGQHMARNLHRHGMLAGVWNRTSAKAEALNYELRLTTYADPRALAAACDALCLCVSADADVRALVDTIEPTLPQGFLILDLSTIGADTARQLAAPLARRGIDFVDCPVTGGVEGARQATLVILCGGEAAAFARAEPILACLGKTIVHFGASGTGQAAKATNQIMCAGIIEVIAEALAFARSENLPLDKLIDTLGKGAGSSWYFVNRAPYMAEGKFPAGFRVRLHEKDLKICRHMAAQHGHSLPVVESVLAQYAELIARGYGDEDISSIFRLAAERLLGAAS